MQSKPRIMQVEGRTLRVAAEIGEDGEFTRWLAFNLVPMDSSDDLGILDDLEDLPFFEDIDTSAWVRASKLVLEGGGDLLRPALDHEGPVVPQLQD